jgi:hypothetical protein
MSWQHANWKCSDADLHLTINLLNYPMGFLIQNNIIFASKFEGRRM